MLAIHLRKDTSVRADRVEENSWCVETTVNIHMPLQRARAAPEQGSVGPPARMPTWESQSSRHSIICVV